MSCAAFTHCARCPMPMLEFNRFVMPINTDTCVVEVCKYLMSLYHSGTLIVYVRICLWPTENRQRVFTAHRTRLRICACRNEFHVRLHYLIIWFVGLHLFSVEFLVSFFSRFFCVAFGIRFLFFLSQIASLIVFQPKKSFILIEWFSINGAFIIW